MSTKFFFLIEQGACPNLLNHQQRHFLEHYWNAQTQNLNILKQYAQTSYPFPSQIKLDRYFGLEFLVGESLKTLLSHSESEPLYQKAEQRLVEYLTLLQNKDQKNERIEFSPCNMLSDVDSNLSQTEGAAIAPLFIDIAQKFGFTVTHSSFWKYPIHQAVLYNNIQLIDIFEQFGFPIYGLKDEQDWITLAQKIPFFQKDREAQNFLQMKMNKYLLEKNLILSPHHTRPIKHL